MAEKMSGYCYVYLDSGSHTNALVNGGALRRPAEAKGRSVFDQLVMGRTLLLAETTLRAKRASHRFRMQQEEYVLYEVGLLPPNLENQAYLLHLLLMWQTITK